MSRDHMKIFTFKNRHMNYCSGQYYFIAETLTQAKKMARSFLREHHKKQPQPAYQIEFEDKVEVSEVTPGYLPLGRSYKKLELKEASKRARKKTRIRASVANSGSRISGRGGSGGRRSETIGGRCGGGRCGM